jgi:hypothetical protein
MKEPRLWLWVVCSVLGFMGGVLLANAIIGWLEPSILVIDASHAAPIWTVCRHQLDLAIGGASLGLTLSGMQALAFPGAPVRSTRWVAAAVLGHALGYGLQGAVGRWLTAWPSLLLPSLGWGIASGTLQAALLSPNWRSGGLWVGAVVLAFGMNGPTSYLGRSVRLTLIDQGHLDWVAPVAWLTAMVTVIVIALAMWLGLQRSWANSPTPLSRARGMLATLLSVAIVGVSIALEWMPRWQ